MAIRLTDQDDNWTGYTDVSGIINIDDMVFAEDGNDTLHGGGGNDDLRGQDGNDTIFGEAGNDILRGDDGINVELGTGDDTLDGGTGNDTLFGGAGMDTLLGGDGNDDMFGGTGDDTLRGGTGSDELFGGDGNDRLFSSGPFSQGGPIGADTGFVTYLDTVGDAALDAADTLDGGAGNDTITVAHDFTGTTTIDGGDDIDELRFGVDGSHFKNSPPADIFNTVDLEAQTGVTPFGGQMIVRGIENVTGDDYRDVFRGDDNANVLRGNEGDDRLEGRGGADTLDGGAGAHDVADYASSLGVDVDLERATQLRNDAQGDVLIDIEDIEGSKYADNLRGDDGANRLFGNNGGDLLEGRGGADTLDGGLGTDVASYESSALGVNVRLDDQVIGTASFAFGGDADSDTLISVENLIGSARNDVLAGNSGINRIEGGNGNDVIHGLDGADTLLGQGGDDTVSGDGGNDVVDGGLGSTLR